jgi:signal peptidase I
VHYSTRFSSFLAANRSLFVFLTLMAIFRSAIADWMHVPSGSMNPTLVEGDRILVNKMAYGLRVPFTTIRLTTGQDPQRGDIVVFDSPTESKALVKRVIGLPGDAVEMRDERLRINGREADYAKAGLSVEAALLQTIKHETHLSLYEELQGRAHPIMILPDRPAMRSFGPIFVPQGQYLLLGDSRDNSKDSRFIGFVSRERIVGRTARVAFSLDPENYLLPRSHRFLVDLQ